MLNNRFKVESSLHNVIYKLVDRRIDIKATYDIYGKEERFEINIKKRSVYARALEYNCIGQLIKMSEKIDTPKVTMFNYTDTGHIQQVREVNFAHSSYMSLI